MIVFGVGYVKVVFDLVFGVEIFFVVNDDNWMIIEMS